MVFKGCRRVVENWKGALTEITLRIFILLLPSSPFVWPQAFNRLASGLCNLHGRGAIARGSIYTYRSPQILESNLLEIHLCISTCCLSPEIAVIKLSPHGATVTRRRLDHAS